MTIKKMLYIIRKADQMFNLIEDNDKIAVGISAGALTVSGVGVGVGMDECVETALNACEEKNLKMITVEKAAQWPKLIIYTETLAPEFTENVVYEQYPIPWSFTTGDITVQTRIDYDTITQESVYIIYFTDYDIFKDDFDMIKIYDWYVAIPK